MGMAPNARCKKAPRSKVRRPVSFNALLASFSGRRERPDDEGGLAVSVSLPVELESLGEFELQGSVLTSQFRIGSEQVAKSEPVMPERASEGNEVEVMSSHREGRLTEPVHNAGHVFCVLVSGSTERLLCGLGLGQRGHSNQ